MEGGGGGGGGPAPFLVKTYEMVDDSSTDGIVSWSSAGSSFVVWDPPEFSRLLLPSYFKHSNFSSFIRQLNTYGFRKIDPERWEFSNEEFVKGKKHLLKNIHRRKPIHSHSNPPPGSGVDPERAALEDEIERLSREKAALQAELWRFQQHETGTKSELDDLGLRVLSMEQRQQKMAKFLEKAVQHPTFVEHLILTAEASSNDPSVLNKKRRQLLSDGVNEHTDRSFTNSQTSSPSAPEFGHMFPRDFCSKLKLELSPTISDGNIMSVNSQSSNDDAGSPRRGQLEATRLRTECLSFAPKVAELVDTGASLCPRENVWQTDDHLSCHLNLTLASSLLQSAKSDASEKGVAFKDPNTDGATELRSNNINSDCDISLANGNEQINGDANAKRASSQNPATTNNPAPSAATGRVNDVFWEQFLTERPGSTTAEEASSSLRANPQEERPEERKLRDDTSWTNRKGMEKLTL